ncbi:peptidylprolyl isomerase [Hirschia litorea]|uniref:Parvulin-like PPIase n=1 Tax=Hirschia litorea TaxID=1199156 RepID=A0ABW2IGR8_9PROT
MTRFTSRLKKLAIVSTSFLVCSPLLTAPLTASAQEAPAVEASEGIVAIVNDKPITYEDVRQRTQFILISLGVAPNEETIRQAQTRAVESLIDEKLQMEEAAEYDLEVSEEEIDEAIANLAAGSNVTVDAFLASLAQRGLNPRTLRDQIRADTAWRQLVGGRFGSRVRISDLQIDDNLERLEKNLDETQYRIAEIFLPASGQEEFAQVFQGAWELKRQIEAGTAPFGAVARQFSASPTASAGGEVGWLGETQLKAAYADQIKALQGPGITEPIMTDNGVYLISLINKQAPVEAELSGFDLKQIYATGANAEAAVSEAASQINSCSNLNAETAAAANVKFADLGETKIEELSTSYFDFFNALPEGGKSQILNLNDDKAALVFVCSRIMSRGSMPTREEVEDKLHGEMVEMMASRYLRDLRREATIIRR